MPQLERTPAPRAARWLPRPAGFESHAPRALLSGDDSRFIRNGNSASLVDFLCAEAQRNTFLGLNMDDEAVGFQIFYRGVAEQDEGSPAKLDHDLRRALREPLSRAQIERHARPAPVVDLQFQSDKCFGIRIRRDIRFDAVASDALAVYPAGTVLAADHVFQDIFGSERMVGVRDL